MAHPALYGSMMAKIWLFDEPLCSHLDDSYGSAYGSGGIPGSHLSDGGVDRAGAAYRNDYNPGFALGRHAPIPHPFPATVPAAAPGVANSHLSDGGTGCVVRRQDSSLVYCIGW